MAQEIIIERPTRAIKLTKPIIGHGEEIRTLVLREPTYSDFMSTGYPYQFHSSGSGETVTIYDNEAIQKYADACLVEPKDASLLRQLGLRDATEVRDQILGFFLDAAKADAASKTSPPNSGSTAASSPTASAA